VYTCSPFKQAYHVGLSPRAEAKATSNLTAIRPIRFDVKTRRRIHPDTLCAAKWLETKPLEAQLYCDALSSHLLRSALRSMCIRVHVCTVTRDNRCFWIRDDILLYGSSCVRIGPVHCIRQIVHVLTGKIPSRGEENTRSGFEDPPMFLSQ